MSSGFCGLLLLVQSRMQLNFFCQNGRACLTGLDWSVLQIKTKIVSCHRADPKLVKQEVSGTVMLPPLVFPARTLDLMMMRRGLCHCALAISWHQFKNL
jgi:hypothetical protein